MTITKLDAHKDGCSKGICTAVSKPIAGPSFEPIQRAAPSGASSSSLNDDVNLLMEKIDKQLSSEHQIEDLPLAAEPTDSNPEYVIFDDDRGTPLLDEVMDIPFDHDLTHVEFSDSAPLLVVRDHLPNPFEIRNLSYSPLATPFLESVPEMSCTTRFHGMEGLSDITSEPPQILVARDQPAISKQSPIRNSLISSSSSSSSALVATESAFRGRSNSITALGNISSEPPQLLIDREQSAIGNLSMSPIFAAPLTSSSKEAVAKSDGRIPSTFASKSLDNLPSAFHHPTISVVKGLVSRDTAERPPILVSKEQPTISKQSPIRNSSSSSSSALVATEKAFRGRCNSMTALGNISSEPPQLLIDREQSALGNLSMSPIFATPSTSSSKEAVAKRIPSTFASKSFDNLPSAFHPPTISVVKGLVSRESDVGNSSLMKGFSISSLQTSTTETISKRGFTTSSPLSTGTIVDILPSTIASKSVDNLPSAFHHPTSTTETISKRGFATSSPLSNGRMADMLPLPWQNKSFAEKTINTANKLLAVSSAEIVPKRVSTTILFPHKEASQQEKSISQVAVGNSSVTKCFSTPMAKFSNCTPSPAFETSPIAVLRDQRLKSCDNSLVANYFVSPLATSTTPGTSSMISTREITATEKLGDILLEPSPISPQVKEQYNKQLSEKSPAKIPFKTGYAKTSTISPKASSEARLLSIVNELKSKKIANSMKTTMTTSSDIEPKSVYTNSRASGGLHGVSLAAPTTVSSIVKDPKLIQNSSNALLATPTSKIRRPSFASGELGAVSLNNHFSNQKINQFGNCSVMKRSSATSSTPEKVFGAVQPTKGLEKILETLRKKSENLSTSRIATSSTDAVARTSSAMFGFEKLDDTSKVTPTIDNQKSKQFSKEIGDMANSSTRHLTTEILSKKVGTMPSPIAASRELDNGSSKTLPHKRNQLTVNEFPTTTSASTTKEIGKAFTKSIASEGCGDVLSKTPPISFVEKQLLNPIVEKEFPSSTISVKSATAAVSKVSLAETTLEVLPKITPTPIVNELKSKPLNNEQFLNRETINAPAQLAKEIASKKAAQLAAKELGDVSSGNLPMPPVLKDHKIKQMLDNSSKADFFTFASANSFTKPVFKINSPKTTAILAPKVLEAVSSETLPMSVNKEHTFNQIVGNSSLKEAVSTSQLATSSPTDETRKELTKLTASKTFSVTVAKEQSKSKQSLATSTTETAPKNDDVVSTGELPDTLMETLPMTVAQSSSISDVVYTLPSSKSSNTATTTTTANENNCPQSNNGQGEPLPSAIIKKQLPSNFALKNASIVKLAFPLCGTISTTNIASKEICHTNKLTAVNAPKVLSDDISSDDKEQNTTQNGMVKKLSTCHSELGFNLNSTDSIPFVAPEKQEPLVKAQGTLKDVVPKSLSTVKLDSSQSVSMSITETLSKPILKPAAATPKELGYISIDTMPSGSKQKTREHLSSSSMATSSTESVSKKPYTKSPNDQQADNSSKQQKPNAVYPVRLNTRIQSVKPDSTLTIDQSTATVSSNITPIVNDPMSSMQMLRESQTAKANCSMIIDQQRNQKRFSSDYNLNANEGIRIMNDGGNTKNPLDIKNSANVQSKVSIAEADSTGTQFSLDEAKSPKDLEINSDGSDMNDESGSRAAKEIQDETELDTSKDSEVDPLDLIIYSQKPIVITPEIHKEIEKIAKCLMIDDPIATNQNQTTGQSSGLATESKKLDKTERENQLVEMIVKCLMTSDPLAKNTSEHSSGLAADSKKLDKSEREHQLTEWIAKSLMTRDQIIEQSSGLAVESKKLDKAQRRNKLANWIAKCLMTSDSIATNQNQATGLAADSKKLDKVQRGNQLAEWITKCLMTSDDPFVTNQNNTVQRSGLAPESKKLDKAEKKNQLTENEKYQGSNKELSDSSKKKSRKYKKSKHRDSSPVKEKVTPTAAAAESAKAQGIKQSSSHRRSSIASVSHEKSHHKNDEPERKWESRIPDKVDEKNLLTTNQLQKSKESLILVLNKKSKKSKNDDHDEYEVSKSDSSQEFKQRKQENESKTKKDSSASKSSSSGSKKVDAPTTMPPGKRKLEEVPIKANQPNKRKLEEIPIKTYQKKKPLPDTNVDSSKELVAAIVLKEKSKKRKDPDSSSTERKVLPSDECQDVEQKMPENKNRRLSMSSSQTKLDKNPGGNLAMSSSSKREQKTQDIPNKKDQLNESKNMEAVVDVSKKISKSSKETVGQKVEKADPSQKLELKATKNEIRRQNSSSGGTTKLEQKNDDNQKRNRRNSIDYPSKSDQKMQDKSEKKSSPTNEKDLHKAKESAAVSKKKTNAPPAVVAKANPSSTQKQTPKIPALSDAIIKLDLAPKQYSRYREDKNFANLRKRDPNISDKAEPETKPIVLVKSIKSSNKSRDDSSSVERKIPDVRKEIHQETKEKIKTERPAKRRQSNEKSIDVPQKRQRKVTDHQETISTSASAQSGSTNKKSNSSPSKSRVISSAGAAVAPKDTKCSPNKRSQSTITSNSYHRRNSYCGNQIILKPCEVILTMESVRAHALAITAERKRKVTLEENEIASSKRKSMEGMEIVEIEAPTKRNDGRKNSLQLEVIEQLEEASLKTTKENSSGTSSATKEATSTVRSESDESINNTARETVCEKSSPEQQSVDMTNVSETSTADTLEFDIYIDKILGKKNDSM